MITLNTTKNPTASLSLYRIHFSRNHGELFVTALFLGLKKIESDDKAKHDIFYSHSKAETELLMKVALMTYLNQSVLQLYQAYKHF